MNMITPIDASIAPNPCGEAADHFIVVDGKEVAGKHVIIDLIGASYLDDEVRIREAMAECVKECGATLLHMHTHVFSPNGGVSGVAVLAESHISVHTWPERAYAAFDVFMCGEAQPEKAGAILKRAFDAETANINVILRGEGA